MKLTKMFIGGAMLMAVSSAAFAQGTEPTKVTPPAQPTPDMQAGLVTVVNRMDGSVVIEPTQSAQANDAAAKAAAEKAAAEKAAAEKLAAAEEAVETVQDQQGSDRQRARRRQGQVLDKRD